MYPERIEGSANKNAVLSLYNHWCFLKYYSGAYGNNLSFSPVLVFVKLPVHDYLLQL